MKDADEKRQIRRLLASLSATMADELSHPLASAQLALDQAQRALGQAHRRRRVLAMVSATLDGAFTAEPAQSLNVRDVLADLPCAGVMLDLPPSLWVFATPGSLDIVLSNLLENARRRSASVRFSAERLEQPPTDAPEPVTLRGPVVLMRVSDEGQAIPEALRSRLFRLAISRAQALGLGNGLWLARRVVRLHGGDLWLESGERGASFASLWPVASEAGAPSIAADGWPTDDKDFGHAIRAQRERLGLTRAQVSALSGVCDSTWRNVEMGRHHVTKSTRIRMVAIFK